MYEKYVHARVISDPSLWSRVSHFYYSYKISPLVVEIRCIHIYNNSLSVKSIGGIVESIGKVMGPFYIKTLARVIKNFVKLENFN